MLKCLKYSPIPQNHLRLELGNVSHVKKKKKKENIFHAYFDYIENHLNTVLKL